MPTINMKSILDKAKACTASAKFQKQIEEKTDEIVLTGDGIARAGKAITIGGASAAAGKFIEVLQNEIRDLEASSGFADGKLGNTAVSALENLEHDSPTKIGKNKYLIAVWFSGNLHRDSLAPDEYEGVDNLAALLNKGYTAKHPVYGVWLGHSGNFTISSLPQRSGAQFIQNAIRNYMANYAADYGVIDIKIDDIYE
nr:MAG TPA: hypothetical protein [Caudoviricetes sp.]